MKNTEVKFMQRDPIPESIEPGSTIECLRDRDLIELNKEGFLIGTQDQREINKGKFPKKKDVDVLARREEERSKTLDRLDRDLDR